MRAPALVPVQEQPRVAETPLAALAHALTPTPLVFVRNHFDVPRLDPGIFRLAVDGAVGQPLELSLRDLDALPSVCRIVTMECAGNGRTLMRPTPKGAAWGLGGASTVEFGGIPLRHLLERARVAPSAVELRFTGADRGAVRQGQDLAFERSLPIEAAISDGPLLARELNGEPLTPEHGFPLRLVVPGWYSVASVKWLQRISALTHAFAGHFQTEEYRYEGEKGVPEGSPVGPIRVRAVIARPADGARLPRQAVEIAGAAWSGAAAIQGVAVTTDGGRAWRAAELRPAATPLAAATWKAAWVPPAAGRYTIAARATDWLGNTQPLVPVWNRRGYGNNVVHRIEVTVA